MSFTDPMVLMLGPRWVKMGLKKGYREYEAKRVAIREMIRHYIRQLKSQLGDSNTKKTLIEAILEENKRESSDVYGEEEMIDQVLTFIFAGA